MKLRTQLLFGYAVIFVLMTLTALVSYHSSTSLLRTQKLVKDSYEVMAAARRLQKSTVDMQTALRGFVIVGEEQYLLPYEEGRDAYQRETQRLKALVADRPRQLERLREIETLVERWVENVAVAEIAARREVTRGELPLEAVTRRLGAENADRELFAAIRDRTDDFIDAERAMLSEHEQAAAQAAGEDLLLVIGGTALAIVLGLAAAAYTTRSVLHRVGGEPSEIDAATREIARGNLDVELEGGTGIRESVAVMLAALQEHRDRTQRQDWLKTGIARLNEAMGGDQDLKTLGSAVMAEMCGYLEVPLGALYVVHEGAVATLTRVGEYAYGKGDGVPETLEFGEGLVGQAANQKQQIIVTDVPADYVRISSALGERVPRTICVTPFLYQRRLRGMIEIGALDELSDQQTEYLQQAMHALATVVEGALSRDRLAKLLTESQQLTEELQSQQEELRVANEELEAQTQQLEQSEQRLKAQQEELQVTNEELEEKNDLLERQKKQVEQGRKDLAVKAEELALASRYKSEFLANMSHELRTPLNSLLLLSQDLARNKSGNLTEEQVEAAEIIHSSGSDLLTLINDVLDLSKIEAGRMDVQAGRVLTNELAENVRASFDHVARQKGLSLDVIVHEDAPAEITSDGHRIGQILRNMLSNAVKFTERGGVTVEFGQPSADATFFQSGLSPDQCLAISVSDTGIGIEPDKQKVIFEAFQQADGGTSRKYGGTGLGLSISRELVRLLGGELQLASEPGQGSTFTLYLPTTPPAAAKALKNRPAASRRSKPPAPVRNVRQQPQAEAPRPAAARPPAAVQIPDDRDNIKEGDRVVLVVEDDPKFARLLLAKCHEKGFQCLLAPTGEDGLELAAQYLPQAVILDVRLPGIDGWAVLSALKDDVRTRHIPVHVASVEEQSTEALRKGAVGQAVKPLDQDRLEEVFQRLEEVSDSKPKRVLVVEDDETLRDATVRLLGDGDVRADQAESGRQAIELLRSGQYDCVVLDLGLPDMGGDELLAALQREGMELPPVVVHTGRELTTDEERALREHAESIVIKDVRSQERLLDEVSLFLHQIVSKMPEMKRKTIHNLHDTDVMLRDKKVLIVDDDMRTTFAMSRLLSDRGMETLKAENGERALRLLEENSDVDLVLMDIMMPVMDGYEAMRRIRSQPGFRGLPIIVLTAKAMPEDREKCLQAGANDYLPKPVDPQRLISMLRVWLHR